MSAPFGNSPWGYEAINQGFATTTVRPSSTILDPNDIAAFHHCFVRGTPVLLADGNRKPIEQIEVGDIVFAFDGCGKLQPRRVLRLFENITTELIELSPAPDHRSEAETVGFTTLTVTPGHAFLTADGEFREIGKTIKQSNLQGAPAQIVLSSGTVIGVQAKHIAWSLETADRYERWEVLSYASVGNTALAPQIEQGWKTYNFEVEDLHTYVAGGVRVHNASDPAFAVDAHAFEQQFGHAFTGSLEDMSLLGGAIATGQLQPTFGNVDTTGTDRFTGPFFTGSGDKIVVSTDSTTWFASMVKNGEIGRIMQATTMEAASIHNMLRMGVCRRKKTFSPTAPQLSSISTRKHPPLQRTRRYTSRRPASSPPPRSYRTRSSLTPAPPSARSSVRRLAARWAARTSSAS